MPTKRLDFVHRFEAAKEQDLRAVLLLLHGTGGDENSMIVIGRALAPDVAMISPRGKVLENGNARYFRRLAEGVLDEEDLMLRTNELADFVKDACAEYGLDSSSVIGIGYSNGANIAASLMLLRPETLAKAVLFRPMVPIVPQTLPDLRGKSVFIAAGQFDSMAPVEETHRLADMLTEAGADVSVHWERAGHELTEGDIRAAAEWMGRR